jgi:PAS domain S-box-containing protein
MRLFISYINWCLMKNFNFLEKIQDLSISGKVKFGFGTSILLILILIISGNYSNYFFLKVFNNSINQNKTINEILEVYGGIQESRNEILSYITQDSNVYVIRMKNYDIMNRLDNLVHDKNLKDYAEYVNKVYDIYNNIVSDFDNIVNLKQELNNQSDVIANIVSNELLSSIKNLLNASEKSKIASAQKSIDNAYYYFIKVENNIYKNNINENIEYFNNSSDILTNLTEQLDKIFLQSNIENSNKNIIYKIILSANNVKKAINKYKEISNEISSKGSVIVGDNFSKITFSISLLKNKAMQEIDDSQKKTIDGFNQYWVINFIVLALMLLFAVIVIFAVLRLISKNIDIITNDLEKLANGDLNFDIKGIGKKNEIGYIASVTENLKKSIAAAEHYKKELKFEHKRYELALEAENSGLWDLDVQTGEMYCSKAWYQILGYDFQMDKNVKFTVNDFASIIDNEDYENFSFSLNKLLQGTDNSFEMEHRIIDKKDNVIWVYNVAKIVTKDSNNNPKRVVGTIRVIDEYREAQYKLKQYSKELEEKTIIIENAKKLADDSNKMKTDFLTGMSYEIRKSMNSIISMANIFADTELSKAQKNSVQEIATSSNDLLQMVNDIIDVAKIETGQVKLEKLPFDLAGIIEDCVSNLYKKAMDKKIELIIDIDDEMPKYFQGDPGRVRQVIWNLLDNAIKYTDFGYVLLKAESLESEIKDKKKIVITVEDTGRGIDASKAATLFDITYQMGNKSNNNSSGTGLGLVINKELCKLMGGDIYVNSVKNEGSIFSFDINLEPDDDLVMFGEMGLGEFLPLKAIIFDDNKKSSEVLLKKCKFWGIDTIISSSMNDLMNNLLDAKKQDNPFKIVFLNYMMEDYDAIEIAKLIKNNYKIKDSNIILMSSVHVELDKKAMEQKGFCSLLYKPIYSHNIKNIITQIIKQEMGDIKKNFIIINKNNKKDFNQVTDKENDVIKGKSILLVQEHHVNLKLTAELFNKIGFSVAQATSGSEGINLMKQKKYDLIAMDSYMQETDSFEMANIIREIERVSNSPNTPIIFLVKPENKDDIDKIDGSYVNDFIEYPFEQEMLNQKIAKWLLTDKKKKDNALISKDDISVLTDELVLQLANDNKFFDKNAFDSLKEIMEEDFRNLINKFFDTAPSCMENIKDSIDSKHAAQMYNSTHTLKSLSLQVGAAEFFALITKLDDAAHADLSDKAAELYNDAMESYNKTEKVIKYLMANV